MGEFETPAAAEVVASQLRHILLTIADSHDNENGTILQMRQEPLPIELELGNQYGVNWDKHHNWIAHQSNAAERAVYLIDNVVILNTTTSTLATPKPLDEIMRQFGGSVRVDTEPYLRPIVVSIRCKTPSIDKAHEIRNLIETHLTQKYVPVPWLAFDGDSQNKDIEEHKQEVIEALLFYEQRDQLLEKYNNAVDSGEKSRLEQELQQFQMQNQLTDNNPVNAHWRLCIDRIKDVQLNGLKLYINQLRFRSMASGFPALLTWLKMLGCVDIEYEFDQLNE